MQQATNHPNWFVAYRIESKWFCSCRIDSFLFGCSRKHAPHKWNAIKMIKCEWQRRKKIYGLLNHVDFDCETTMSIASFREPNKYQWMWSGRRTSVCIALHVGFYWIWRFIRMKIFNGQNGNGCYFAIRIEMKSGHKQAISNSKHTFFMDFRYW